jgi:hypothetical protein
MTQFLPRLPYNPPDTGTGGPVRKDAHVGLVSL